MVGHITLLQKFIFCPNFNFSQMPQAQQKKQLFVYNIFSCLFTFYKLFIDKIRF